MVDQCQFGIHFVWPNPLTNRFTNIQLHPSFWDGRTTALAPDEGGGAKQAAGCVSAAGALPVSSRCPGPGDGLSAVGMEAALYFDKTHTIESNNKLVPTTLIANL